MKLIHCFSFWKDISEFIVVTWDGVNLSMESGDLRVVNCFQMSEIEVFNFLKGYIRNEFLNG